MYGMTHSPGKEVVCSDNKVEDRQENGHETGIKPAMRWLKPQARSRYLAARLT